MLSIKSQLNRRHPMRHWSRVAFKPILEQVEKRALMSVSAAPRAAAFHAFTDIDLTRGTTSLEVSNRARPDTPIAHDHYAGASPTGTGDNTSLGGRAEIEKARTAEQEK